MYVFAVTTIPHAPPRPLPPLGEIPELASLRYTERFSEARLDALRAQGDPLSDRVVAELAAAGQLEKFHDLLGAVRELAAAGSAACQELLESVRVVPSWMDFGAIVAGQRMIAAFPAHMGISLFAGSLCGGAVFQKMAIITGMTGMFSGQPRRRLDETAKMVVGMAFTGSLEPGGDGHELLVRVRLLHSALRRFLVDSGRYRHASEVPINQHDLAITLALFGYLNVRSLVRMGVRFSDEELASYNLLWRYAGYVLGIDEAVLPRSLEEQRELFYVSVLHQGRPEKIPPATKGLIDAVARDATVRAPAAYPAARRFLHQSCRWLSGNEYVSGMELEDAGDRDWTIVALRATGVVSGVLWRVPGGKALMTAAGRRFYRAWLDEANARKDHAGEYRVRTGAGAHPGRMAQPNAAAARGGER
jgi:hypothetical protein